MNGFCNSGPKSIMAPIPMKISNGNSSVLIPALKRTSKTPSDSDPLTIWVRTPVPGKLTKMVPSPIGTSNVGSYSFLIPKYIRTAPISIIAIWPIVMDVIPANSVSIYSLPPNKKLCDCD